MLTPGINQVFIFTPIFLFCFSDCTVIFVRCFNSIRGSIGTVLPRNNFYYPSFTRPVLKTSTGYVRSSACRWYHDYIFSQWGVVQFIFTCCAIASITDYTTATTKSMCLNAIFVCLFVCPCSIFFRPQDYVAFI